MRRITLSRAAMLAMLCIGSIAPPVHAQGLLDALRKKAAEAKRAADDIKRRADSVAAVTGRAKAAVDSLGSSSPQQSGAARGARTAPNAPAAGSTGMASPGMASPGMASPGMASSPVQGLNRNAARIEEQVVLTGDRLEYILSPQGQHVAARTLKGSRTVITLDGVAGPPVDEIPEVLGMVNRTGVFSDDGTHFAYVARQGQQWVVMADGKEAARGTPAVQPSSPSTVKSIGFTANGRLYFSTYDETTQAYQLTVDGKPDPVIRGAITPVFSPDGSRHAYEFVYNQETGRPLPALMVDGKRASYPGANLQFTADGQHLFAQVPVPTGGAIDIMLDGRQFMRVPGAEVHLAPKGSGMIGTVLSIPPTGNRFYFVTVGNRRVPNSDCHGGVSLTVFFSADAKHWAARCQDTPTSMWVMTDGKRGQEYQSIPSEVQFTTDGKAVYLAKANGKDFIIVGEQELGPYDNVQLQPRPIPNNNVVTLGAVQVAGNHIGFMAKETSGSDLNRIVVVDGKSYKSVMTADLAFNADGSHFAYTEGQAQPRTVVLDGVKRFSVPLTWNGSDDVVNPFTFSPDGQRFAFASANTRAQKFAVALDDRLLPSDAMWHVDLTFAPDGKHIFYLGRPNGGRERVFIDGTPVLEIDQAAGQHRTPLPWMGFASDGTLTLVGRDGNTLKRYHIAPR